MHRTLLYKYNARDSYWNLLLPCLNYYLQRILQKTLRNGIWFRAQQNHYGNDVGPLGTLIRKKNNYFMK